ncbi:hypothetical protein R1flu_000500 [Riccia fluitans]|uniref:Uncharacterized protein n=1 Tax=Riccia fluitans TaxID=41844 RepID=A0ABD1Y0M1_9MARC
MAIHGLAGGSTQFYCSTEFDDILSADVTSSLGDNIESIGQCAEGYLTTRCWSPTRPAVIYADCDGVLENILSLRGTSYKEKVAMGNFFARQQVWVADVKNRSKERGKQIQKAMEEKAILKERAE